MAAAVLAFTVLCVALAWLVSYGWAVSGLATALDLSLDSLNR
jgi:hypothetical protein